MNTITDTELKLRGIEALIAALGVVQAERFVNAIRCASCLSASFYGASRISSCRNDGAFAIMRMAEASAKLALRWTFNAKLYA
jgi:hypothetical protein